MNLSEFIHTDAEAKNALIGTILCDGSLSKNRRKDGTGGNVNAALEVTHTSKNLDYLKVKKELLDMMGISSKISEHNKKTSDKQYFLYRLSTSADLWFTQLRDILYDKQRNKLMPCEIIDNLFDLALFFMYLDDGILRVRCYPGTSKIRECRITFCTDRFTLSEVQYFQKHLLETYGISTKYYRHSKNVEINRGFRLWTNTENTNKLMQLFDKYYCLVPSMQYKFTKYYSL